MIKAISKRTDIQSIKADCLFFFDKELSSFLDLCIICKCLYKTNEYSICKTERLKTHNILLLNDRDNFSNIHTRIHEAVLAAIDYGFYSIAIILNKNTVNDRINFLSEELKKFEDIEIKLYTNNYFSYKIKEPRLRKLESNRFDLALEPAPINDVAEDKHSINYVVPSTVKPIEKDSLSLQYQSLCEWITSSDESLYKIMEHIIETKKLYPAKSIYDAARIDPKNYSKNMRKCQDDEDNRTTISKDFAICLCIGFKLSYEESIAFLEKAGYALSPILKRDKMISEFLRMEVYYRPSIFDLNDELNDANLPSLGSNYNNNK